MKIDTIQTSFAGGEIAPSLFGRTDVVQYSTAVAELENFLVRPYGSVISCPGTEFINECKTGGSTSIARLIPFVFSRTDSYVIEMGVGYFRFYTDGAVVVSPGTTVYEVAHTYTAAELFDVQYCQLNDVIYLTHPSHKPQTLTRMSASSWVLADFVFTGGPFMPDNIENITITASGTNGTINLTVSPTNSELFVVSGATIGHLNTYWKLGGTSTNATTGLDEQGYVQITNVVNSYTATASVIKPLTITALTASTLWAEGSWSVVNGYPARVTFHQQRLFLARTNEQPQNVWGSKTFEYTNFAVDGGEDDDALDIELSSNESNDIKWLASGQNLIAGTYGGEFTISAADNGVLTPANTKADKQTSWGSEDIPPKRIGNFLYYVQRFYKKLRELFYYWDLDTYKSVDRTIFSPHITNDGIVDMAFQQNPDTVLWCVCSNGTIATLTREIDQEVAGWARQTTDGKYESICAIPSIDETYDEIWVIVNRTIGDSALRYIERFKNTEVPIAQDDCWYVHSGLRYDAYSAYTSTSISIISSGTLLITSSSAYFSADDVGMRIRAMSSGTIVGEAKIIGYTSSSIVVGSNTYAFTTGTVASGSWGLSVDTILGLNHLEGETVVVLADGGTDKPDKVVSNGSITLTYNYFKVLAGLPYTQKLKTLPQEAGSQRGTSQGKIQRINQVGFKVNRSHKGFLTGGATDMLDQIRFRDPSTLMGQPELLYTGVIPNITFRDDYRYGSQILVQNSDPLPIELLSIISTIDTNDR